jgi:hypothetical protein
MPNLSASISLTTASITVGQVLNATLTVSNSSGTPINVMQILPKVNSTGNPIPMDGSSVAYGDVPLGQGFNNVIPASGSATFPLSYSIYSPSTGPSNTGSGTYDVTASVIGNNGEQVSASPSTVTVHPVLPLF